MKRRNRKERKGYFFLGDLCETFASLRFLFLFYMIKTMLMKQPISGAGSHNYAPEKKYKVLTEKEWVLVRAIAERIYPAGGGISLSADDVNVVDFFDEYLSEAPKSTATGLRIFLRLFE